MNKLKEYIKLEKEIHEYFGYKESWKVHPLEDSTEFFWTLDDDGVIFADYPKNLGYWDGDYYHDDFYYQLNPSLSIYRGEEYTMILVDTRTDGNSFLRIFDNKKEVVSGRVG